MTSPIVWQIWNETRSFVEESFIGLDAEEKCADTMRAFYNEGHGIEAPAGYETHRVLKIDLQAATQDMSAWFDQLRSDEADAARRARNPNKYFMVRS